MFLSFFRLPTYVFAIVPITSKVSLTKRSTVSASEHFRSFLVQDRCPSSVRLLSDWFVMWSCDKLSSALSLHKHTPIIRIFTAIALNFAFIWTRTLIFVTHSTTTGRMLSNATLCLFFSSRLFLLRAISFVLYFLSVVPPVCCNLHQSVQICMLNARSSILYFFIFISQFPVSVLFCGELISRKLINIRLMRHSTIFSAFPRSWRWSNRQSNAS